MNNILIRFILSLDPITATAGSVGSPFIKKLLALNFVCR